MADLLSVGANAVTQYQRALSTVSNNIANANTEGYSRQRVEFAEGAPANRGGLWFGTGARLENVTRLFSGLVENNLRNSTSDFEAQGPLIQETTRILDIFGSSSAGVSSALDRFFSSVREWSTDADSASLRTQLLSDAEQLVERFRSMDAALISAEQDTAAAIREEIDTINTYAAELANINRSLGRQTRLDKQAPALLDQRDLLLRKLSEHVRIDVAEAPNGTVDVSVGFSASSLKLVDGTSTNRLHVSLDAFDPGRVEIGIGNDRVRETLGGLGGGTLGGHLSVRETVLGSASASLDQVVRVFVEEINQTHSQGIDQFGRIGGDFFRIDPQYQIDTRGLEIGDFAASSEVLDPGALTGNDITLRYDPGTARWSAIDEGTGESAEANAENRIELSGLSIQVRGSSNSLVDLSYRATNSAAGGLSVALARIEELAAAAPLRVRPDETNASPVNPQLSILPAESVTSSVPSLDTRLVDNLAPGLDSALVVTPSYLAPIARIPAGYADVALALTGATTSDLQIFTREGRQLAGSVIDEIGQDLLLTPANGFVDGATYSDAYLAGSGGESYADLSIFRGARAEPGQAIGLDGLPVAIEALMRPAGRVDMTSAIAGGALSLNGVEITDPLPAGLDAVGLADALNALAGTGVEARAYNEIRLPQDQLRLDRGLKLNGELIGASFSDARSLIDAVNAKTASTGISAYLSPEGDLVLANVGDEAGKDIAVGDYPGGGNALGITAGTYAGFIELQGQVSNGVATPVELQLNASGTPSDLARIGLSTQVYIDGATNEDLLIFVTGGQTERPSLTASYTEGSLTPIEQMRAREFKIEFTADDTYQVKDSATDTILAERTGWSVDQTLTYGPIALNFRIPPTAGDVFIVDDNASGVADNSIAQSIADLETKRIDALQGNSVGQAYSQIVVDLGNQVRQAQLSEEALAVVRDQAVEARDQLSGVSLDEEATDLIRYQQAYQASAKIIQTSQQLFDSILAIR